MKIKFQLNRLISTSIWPRLTITWWIIYIKNYLICQNWCQKIKHILRLSLLGCMKCRNQRTLTFLRRGSITRINNCGLKQLEKSKRLISRQPLEESWIFWLIQLSFSIKHSKCSHQRKRTIQRRLMTFWEFSHI